MDSCFGARSLFGHSGTDTLFSSTQLEVIEDLDLYFIRQIAHSLGVSSHGERLALDDSAVAAFGCVSNAALAKVLVRQRRPIESIFVGHGLFHGTPMLLSLCSPLPVTRNRRSLFLNVPLRRVPCFLRLGTARVGEGVRLFLDLMRGRSRTPRGGPAGRLGSVNYERSCL